MAAVLRGSRCLVGRFYKNVDFAFGKENKLRPFTHCARRCTLLQKLNLLLESSLLHEHLVLLEMLEEKFELIFARQG